jgi:amino acid adenylation domain-containing protein
MTVHPSNTAGRNFIPFPLSEIEQSIPERFDQQVRRYPDRLAVKSQGCSFTYATLDEKSNRIANAILNMRDSVEEPVVLLIGQGANLVAGIMAALKSGKLYVPQDSAMPTSSIRRVLDDCCAPLIMTDHQNLKLSAELAGSRSVLNIDQIARDVTAIAPEVTVPPDRAAYIFYTSGSTGTPKGVVDNHRNVLHNIMRYTNNLEINSMDRLSLVQSCSFSGSVSSLFCALLNGAAIFPFDLRRASAKEWAAWVNRERLTMFHSVPTIFQQLVLTGNSFPSLRIIRLEGDQATRKHVNLFRKQFNEDCLLVNGLGTTETGIIRQFFINYNTRLKNGAVPIGYPIQDMEVCLLDDNGQQVPNGGLGEITVTSRYLATGYWKKPELTARAFTHDANGSDLRTYRTGDMGILSEDGCLTYCGRRNFEIRIRGQRINIAAIENGLTAIQGIEDAAVSTYKHNHGVEQLVAYIVVPNGLPPTVNFLRQRLSAEFPNHEIPTRYIVLSSLPLDPNGKIKRSALPAPRSERPHLDPEYVEPRTSSEKLLAGCFSDILGIENIGVNDSFYDLGGDSLKAVELAMLIEQKLVTEVRPELIFEEFTVADVCESIGRQEQSNGVIVLQANGTETPLFLFHAPGDSLWGSRKLATKLRPERPVYGLHFTGNPKGFPVDKNIEDLAAHCLHQIQAVRPVGPYLLAGQCLGGLLAFEAAQQLRAQKQEIAQLILIDTPCIIGPTARIAQRLSLRRNLYNMSSMPLRKAVGYLAARFQNLAQYVLTIFWLRIVLLTGHCQTIKSLLLRFRPDSNNIRRVVRARYEVRPYDGSMVLICIGSQKDQVGWKTVAKNGAEIVELSLVEGAPLYMHLTDEPYLSSLVEELEPRLNPR